MQSSTGTCVSLGRDRWIMSRKSLIDAPLFFNRCYIQKRHSSALNRCSFFLFLTNIKVLEKFFEEHALPSKVKLQMTLLKPNCNILTVN